MRRSRRGPVSEKAGCEREIKAELHFAGKPEEAVARLNESSQILDRLAAANPRDVQTQVDAGTTYVALMDVLGSPGGGLTNQSSKD